MPLDPHDLYDVAPDAGEVSARVLLVALTGFVDAGGAGGLAREHLLSTLESRVVASFDVDQLYDYRARRPTMLFNQDHWESYDDPRLDLHLVHDATGTPFLLLAGPEPDVQWERFTQAVEALIERFRVEVTVAFNSIPMAVPHTRPSGVTAHATRPELISGYVPWLQQVQVPGSAAHLLEFRLGQHGRDAIGFAVHVPHYLAQTGYPTAAEVLLQSVSRATGLLLPTEALTTAAAAVRAEVDAQVEGSEEIAAVVRGLEEQYDAFVRGQDQSLLAADTGPLPSAEELGAELERFLAEQSRRDEPPGS